jgi:hypothetical protein
MDLYVEDGEEFEDDFDQEEEDDMEDMNDFLFDDEKVIGGGYSQVSNISESKIFFLHSSFQAQEINGTQ